MVQKNSLHEVRVFSGGIRLFLFTWNSALLAIPAKLMALSISALALKSLHESSMYLYELIHCCGASDLSIKFNIRASNIFSNLFMARNICPYISSNLFSFLSEFNGTRRFKYNLANATVLLTLLIQQWEFSQPSTMLIEHHPGDQPLSVKRMIFCKYLGVGIFILGNW